MAPPKNTRAATAETVNGPQGDRLTGSIFPTNSQEDRAGQFLLGRPELLILLALQITRNERVMEEADEDRLHRHPKLTECEQFSFVLFELMHRFDIAAMEAGHEH